MCRQQPIQTRVKTGAFVSRAGYKTAGKPALLYRYKTPGFYPPVIRVPYGELEKRYLRSFRNISYEIFRCPRGARTGTPIFGDRLLFRRRENRKAMTKDRVRHERPPAVRPSQGTARKNVPTEGRPLVGTRRTTPLRPSALHPGFNGPYPLRPPFAERSEYLARQMGISL